MAKKTKKYPGVQKRFEAGGFKALWRYAKGHGLKRWIKIRNWARKRAAHNQSPEGFKNAVAEYQKKIDHLQKHHGSTKPNGTCTIEFDGRTVPKWIADRLTRARKTGLWHGQCISGVRTVAESIALCEAMCNAVACPGRCAGANTNHTCPPSHKCCFPEGAADCTDPYGLAAALRTLGITDLIGDGAVLPADVNHFSHAGN